MAKKPVHLPRRVVCQQILQRLPVADGGNDRCSQIGLACGIASALTAEWVETDGRSAAGEPAMILVTLTPGPRSTSLTVRLAGKASP